MPSATAMIDDCWNHIGVRGNGSCRELGNYIHCHNCPAYTAAASVLLDRPLPAGYLEDWASRFAAERSAGDSGTEGIVVFRIAQEWLGLPTALFSEFVDMRAIHSLPHRRHSALLGLVNVRGELLVCVSLGKVLGIVEKEKRTLQQRATRERLVVLREQNGRIVFPVDEVHGIHRFGRNELKEVPATIAKATGTYTRAMLQWDDKTIGCLDEQLLFYTLNRGLA